MSTVHSYAAYANGRCRCERCRAAAATYQAGARERRAARLHDDPRAAPHGCSNTYTNWGCRCRACTTAATVAKADYLARTGR